MNNKLQISRFSELSNRRSYKHSFANVSFIPVFFSSCSGNGCTLVSVARCRLFGIHILIFCCSFVPINKQIKWKMRKLCGTASNVITSIICTQCGNKLSLLLLWDFDGNKSFMFLEIETDGFRLKLVLNVCSHCKYAWRGDHGFEICWSFCSRSCSLIQTNLQTFWWKLLFE